MLPGRTAVPICSRLSSGDGAAILVADFEPFNNAPRLSRLLSEAATGQPVYQVDPRGALSGDRIYATLPELADEAVAFFGSAEANAATYQPVFVVGHCSAASLSLQIAGRLAEDREVNVILVQPTWPDTEHVAERFAEFQGKLGMGRHPCPDLNGDPWSCVVEMKHLMWEGLTAIAGRLGRTEPPQAFSELLVSYQTWLAFLLACRNDQPLRPPDAVALSVLTPDPDFVLPGTAPGRCRLIPPPPAEQPDAVTPELAKVLLQQISGH